MRKVVEINSSDIPFFDYEEYKRQIIEKYGKPLRKTYNREEIIRKYSKK